MAKIIVYLREQDHDALYQLAQKEYRQPKAQAALIIRRELERLGMLDAAFDATNIQEGSEDAPSTS
jgi:hypothetical protein